MDTLSPDENFHLFMFERAAVTLNKKNLYQCEQGLLESEFWLESVLWWTDSAGIRPRKAGRYGIEIGSRITLQGEWRIDAIGTQTNALTL